MMDGITVLYQATGGGCVNHSDVSAFILAFLFCILAILLLIVIGKRNMTFKSHPSYVVTAAIAMVMSFIMVLVGVYMRRIPTYEIYKASIDSNVSFVEFYDRYEVLDQEGNIYTIRERNVEE